MKNAILLEEVGIFMDEAENGQLGIEKSAADEFDVSLVDVQMPVKLKIQVLCWFVDI